MATKKNLLEGLCIEFSRLQLQATSSTLGAKIPVVCVCPYLLHNHQVTSSCIGNEVALDDSKFSGGELSSSLIHQLALVYKPRIVVEDGETDPFVVHVCPVQQEDGNDDCGVCYCACIACNRQQQASRCKDEYCLKKKFVQFPTKGSVNIGLHTYRESELFCQLSYAQDLCGHGSV